MVPIYWYGNRSQLYAVNQHFSFNLDKYELKINLLELYDNKIVTHRVFRSAMSSATNILCNTE